MPGERSESGDVPLRGWRKLLAFGTTLVSIVVMGVATGHAEAACWASVALFGAYAGGNVASKFAYRPPGANTEHA